MAQRTAKKVQKRNGTNGTNGKARVNGNGKSNGNGNGSATIRMNWKAEYETMKARYDALQAEIADVNLMLDAIECPPNCGTINGRMVEYARKNYKKYGSMTNPGGEARKMLHAVEAPVQGNGAPWSLYSDRVKREHGELPSSSSSDS